MDFLMYMAAALTVLTSATIFMCCFTIYYCMKSIFENW